MTLSLQDLLTVLFAFVGCCGFAVIFNIHGAGILICSLGGALGWLAYLLTAPLLHDDILQTFVAAAVISAYAEGMARLRKCPVTGYQLVAIFPLVPGGGIYYTMEYAINGDVDSFLSSFLHTIGVAGAIAAGVLMVSSLVHMRRVFHRRALSRKGG